MSLKPIETKVPCKEVQLEIPPTEANSMTFKLFSKAVLKMIVKYRDFFITIYIVGILAIQAIIKKFIFYVMCSACISCLFMKRRFFALFLVCTIIVSSLYIYESEPPNPGEVKKLSESDNIQPPLIQPPFDDSSLSNLSETTVSSEPIYEEEGMADNSENIQYDIIDPIITPKTELESAPTHIAEHEKNSAVSKSDTVTSDNSMLEESDSRVKEDVSSQKETDNVSGSNTKDSKYEGLNLRPENIPEHEEILADNKSITNDTDNQEPSDVREVFKSSPKFEKDQFIEKKTADVLKSNSTNSENEELNLGRANTADIKKTENLNSSPIVTGNDPKFSNFSLKTEDSSSPTEKLDDLDFGLIGTNKIESDLEKNDLEAKSDFSPIVTGNDPKFSKFSLKTEDSSSPTEKLDDLDFGLIGTNKIESDLEKNDLEAKSDFRKVDKNNDFYDPEIKKENKFNQDDNKSNPNTSNHYFYIPNDANSDKSNEFNKGDVGELNSPDTLKPVDSVISRDQLYEISSQGADLYEFDDFDDFDEINNSKNSTYKNQYEVEGKQLRVGTSGDDTESTLNKQIDNPSPGSGNILHEKTSKPTSTTPFSEKK